MRELREGADRFAAGDFSGKLLVPSTVEFAAVAEAMNRMAAELDDKLRTLTRERNEREAVLESMVEGVIAVDPDGRVIAINSAAARLLDVGARDVVGMSIEEAVRNPELQRAVHAVLTGEDSPWRRTSRRSSPARRGSCRRTARCCTPRTGRSRARSWW